MTKSRILIIDGNNTAYQAFYSHKRLNHETGKTYPNEHGQLVPKLSKKKSVGCIYGFPSIIKKVIKDKEPDKVIITWDGGSHPDRLALLPEYKCHRKSSRPFDYKNFKYQRKQVMRLMYAMGITQVYAKGMEADDWIYMLVEKYRKEFDEVIILSRDKDFFQLIKGNVWCYDHAQIHVNGFITKKSLKNPKKFKKQVPPNYGYYPRQAIDYLSLVGDKSDDIPGYPQIGHMRALSFLNIHGSIKEFLNSDETHSIIKRKKLRKIWKRNRLVIGLKPFYKKYIKGKIELTYYKDKPEPKFSKRRLVNFCIDWNISLLRKKSFYTTYRSLTR